MSHGLKTTFELLGNTANEAAASVLLAALDSPRREIQEHALRGILQRRSAPGMREIIRRVHTMDERWRELLRERRGRISPALRDAVLGSDPQMVTNGCRAAIWFCEYDLIPTLINAMENEAHEHADLAAETLLALAELLYQDLKDAADYRARRDPETIRKNVTVSLEQSVLRFPKHRRIEAIEAFLMLAKRDNAVLQKILADPHHMSFVAVMQVLMHNTRGAVMRLMLGFLDDAQAPSAAISALAHRHDKPFVELLLRKIGAEPSAAAKANLQRVDTIGWLQQDTGLLDTLSEAAQHSAVQLLMSTAMKPGEALRAIEHLLNYGNVGGRRAAAAALATISGADATALAVQALHDDDPQVQALAVAQLRPRGVPGALSKLIELIDSPHHLVRRAAQESLGEFNFDRYLSSFDMLPDDVRQSTGRLVRKVDPTAVPKLQAELASPAAKRRMRALAIAVVVGMVGDVEDTVIELVGDDDHLVRLEAVRALAHGQSPLAAAVLSQARYDSSSAVQEAAHESLHLLAQRKSGESGRQYSLELHGNV